MQATMLGDEWAAIDADDIMMWKCFVELFLGLDVVGWVTISRHQNRSVYD